jgi:hypothetical protein
MPKDQQENVPCEHRSRGSSSVLPAGRRNPLEAALLELFHHQIGNHLEVPRIARHESVAQMQCSGSDQQILKRYLGARIIERVIAHEQISLNVQQLFTNQALQQLAGIQTIAATVT